MTDPLNFEVPTEGPYFQLLQEIANRYNSLKAENDNLLDIVFDRSYDPYQDESDKQNYREPSLMEATHMLIQDLSGLLKGNDDMKSVENSLNQVGKLLGKEEVTFNSRKVNDSIISDDSIEKNQKYVGEPDVGIKERFPISSPTPYHKKRVLTTVTPDTHDGNSYDDSYDEEEEYSEITSTNISHDTFDSEQSSWDEEGYHDLMERLSDPKQKVLVKRSFALRLLSELGMEQDECIAYVKMNSIGSNRCILSVERLIQLSDILMREREDYIDNVIDLVQVVKESQHGQIVEYDEEDQASI